MNWLALASAVIVGAVFVVAGVMKLVQREQWRVEAAGMKVPSWLVPVVPVVEVVIGAAVLTQILRPITAGIAALVLLAFTMAILARLAEGEHPPCACFGSLSSRPLGARHVVRNVALIIVAMIAALF